MLKLFGDFWEDSQLPFLRAQLIFQEHYFRTFFYKLISSNFEKIELYQMK